MSANLIVDLQAEAGRKRVRDVLGRFSKMQPVMRGPVRRLVREAIQQQFASRGAFGGSRWPDLSERTKREKRRVPGWKKAPMRRTDTLFRSLTIFSAPYREEDFEDNGYTLRTLVAYARYHQSTAERTSRLPRRAVIPDTLPEPFMRRLRNIFEGFLVRGEVAS